MKRPQSPGQGPSRERTPKRTRAAPPRPSSKPAAELPPSVYSAFPSGVARRVVGRILKFDRPKGFGFIQGPGAEDIFFNVSVLPPDLQNASRSGESLLDVEVEVELTTNEAGKPRAQSILALGPPAGGRGGGSRGSRPERLQVLIGTVIQFDVIKNFGFICPDGGGEDVFVLRSELPPELWDVHVKEQILNLRVEFEVKTMPDGKQRAQRCAILGPPPWTLLPPMDLPGFLLGRVKKFDRSKGYGFLEVPGHADVFFLPSQLPQDLRDRGDQIEGYEFAFDMDVNEEGRPRAVRLRAPPPHPGFAPMGPPVMGLPPPGYAPTMGRPLPAPPLPAPPAPPPSGPGGRERRPGRIVKYYKEKGYGFIASPSVDADVFFPRYELPSEFRESGFEELSGVEVLFQLSVKEGKPRASSIVRSVQAPRCRAQPREVEAEPLLPLLEDLLADMLQFLEDQGGGCDYGKFASSFPKVKKRQLQDHFEISTDGGPPRIEIPGALSHEGRPDAGEQEEQDDSDPGLLAEEEHPMDSEGAEADGDEPSIMLGPGCQPHGVIKSYDAVRGYGFVCCEGLDEDIYFPRSALPEAFRVKVKQELPSLVGVEVSVEMSPSADNRGRSKADRLNLQLRWHRGDRCWLLRR